MAINPQDFNDTTDLDGERIEMVEYDMVGLWKQGGVFKVWQVLVEHCLLEERGKVRGETRCSTARGNLLTVGSRRA